MSRKHYEYVAALLRMVRSHAEDPAMSATDAIDELTKELSSYFASENPNFKPEKFLLAADWRKN